MFVTFKGDSELLLENTLEHARKEIESKIFTLWPHGVEAQIRGSTWSIRFRNSPWNMSGPDVELYVCLPNIPDFSDVHISRAWKLIVALFTLFAVRVRFVYGRLLRLL